MKKLLLLLMCWPMALFSQNTIGLPDVTNYSKQAYGAGLQNWDTKQDRNGIVYVANNEGLLTYDGKNWALYALPNKTIVRSVEIGDDGKIYVGGQDELGYFSPAINGKLQYHSLTPFIPAADKSFGDVWDIAIFNNHLFFRSPKKIFKFNNQTVESYSAPSEWAFLGVCNGRLYAHDYEKGLMTFESNSWEPDSEKNVLAVNDPITSILPLQKGSNLITTLKNGLYMLSSMGISKLATPNNALFAQERIYAATLIDAGWIALATNNSGVYIIDNQGNIIQHISKTEGLQNNNVLSIFIDAQSNMWLGLDNGIDIVAYNSAVKEIHPFSGDGSGYTAIINKGRLYMGTTNGLYSVALQPMHDISFSKGNFLPVPNTRGQTWCLADINNQLLMGHHDGAFVISDNGAVPFAQNLGFWNFQYLRRGPAGTTQMLGGNYNGLQVFNWDGEKFYPGIQIEGLNESSRYVAIDKDGDIWISHPYHGVFKVHKKSNGQFETTAYSNKNGLPSTLNNHVFKIKDQVLIGTEKGVYLFDPQQKSFAPSAFYKAILGTESVRYLKADSSGNIWFIREKKLGVIDLSAKKPVVIYFPELNGKLLSGFEFIYPINGANIILGGEKGFFHLNYEKYKQTAPKLSVQIRQVAVTGNTDSLLFGGYFIEANKKQEQDKKNIPSIKYGWKTLRFEFSTTLFGYQSNLEYSYRLKGYEDNWSDWGRRTDKEYTNLPAGDYVFEMKVRNNLGNQSLVASYAVKILPPWYLSWWAKLGYIILFCVANLLLFQFLKKKFALQQQKHEEEQKRLLYIHDLEINKSENELIELRNGKLEAEINFKNSELASAAMHLVKKGELLAKIKGELSRVMKSIDKPEAVAELRKMNKSLTDDDNLDKEWENFSNHFDKVHGDFLATLKTLHPTITPSELKLSGYLRMNLSTKEVAQLMNITVRGVEVSRYRLRKKLQLPTETNLFQYLFDIGRDVNEAGQ